jgi:DNA-directed RNA polymerase subunit RPC12/RpoP
MGQSKPCVQGAIDNMTAPNKWPNKGRSIKKETTMKKKIIGFKGIVTRKCTDCGHEFTLRSHNQIRCLDCRSKKNYHATSKKYRKPCPVKVVNYHGNDLNDESFVIDELQGRELRIQLFNSALLDGLYPVGTVVEYRGQRIEIACGMTSLPR